MQFGAMWKGLACSAACAAGPLIVALTVRTLCAGQDGRVGIPMLAASTGAAIVVWFVGVSLFNHPLSNEALYRRSLRLVGIAPGMR